jgi:16S rRNA (guanine(966)-N(2))-methyltransferase RsmD
MRITSGRYKGKEIRAAKNIRPTQDNVRKAVFDILGDLEGASFLELFAGSGAVAFEALSRGAAEAVLVEYNADCLLAIRKNIASLKETACSVYPAQVDRAIKEFHRQARHFDIIFSDPPYYRGLAKKTLQSLSAYDILAPDGFLIMQHFKKDDLPVSAGDLTLFKQKSYGDSSLAFYKKAST